MAGNKDRRQWFTSTRSSRSVFSNPEGVMRLMRYGLAREDLDAAKAKGTEGYIWRTMLDERVRESHAVLEDHFFTWDNPPITNEYGDRNHPGGDYNCRCHAEPFNKGDQPTEEPPHRTAGRIEPRSSKGLFSKPTYWDYRK